MLEQNIYRVTCDIKNCKNSAAFNFSAKGRLGKFYVCKECLKKLTEEFQTVCTPKSLKNPIKKALDEKKQTI